MIPLSDDRVEAALREERALLYKHSPACWLSAMAARKVADMETAHPELPVYVLDVLAQRGLSQRLANRLDVPHASPQLILLVRGEPVWDTSHMGISGRRLDRALSAHDQGTSSAGQAPKSDQRSSRS